MRDRIFLLLLFIPVFNLLSCESYPDDPNHSLREAKEKKLRVGAMEAPPWTKFENREVKGIEADIMRGFARKIDSEVEWIKGTEEELMSLLKAYQLHIVIGGITKGTPWKKHISITGSYRTDVVLICNTKAPALPEKIEDLQIGVKKGSAIGAYVKRKKGVPVYLDSLETYKGLIAIYQYDREKLDCPDSNLSIHTEKHVIAVAKGENRLLMALEEYLNEAGY